MGSASQVIVCGVFGTFLAVSLGVYLWFKWEVRRSRQQLLWDRSRSEEAAERFHSGILETLPASPEQASDHRIPFLVVLPDYTLDVALLDATSGAAFSGTGSSGHEHSARNTSPWPGWLSNLYARPTSIASEHLTDQQPAQSLSQRLQQHGIAPLPPARCEEFHGVPDTLVWSIAILDHCHPFFRQSAPSTSSRLASLFRLAATRSLQSQGHHGPSAGVSRSATRWWSARSQELPSVVPTAAREHHYVYQPTDQPATAATSGSSMAHNETRNSSSIGEQGWRQGASSASLYRVNTPDLPPVFAEGAPRLGHSFPRLQLSGRLGSIGSRMAATDAHGHSYQRLEEVLVA